MTSPLLKQPTHSTARDFARELAILVVGFAMRWEMSTMGIHRERARRLYGLLAKLINGRSAEQVEKLERARGLR